MKNETNIIFTLDIFRIIKSKYILKKIFSLPKITRSLNIIRYNKSIQERCDINLNTYIKVFKEINKIEIKIKPTNHFSYYNKDKKKIFINIENPEYAKYCHIYFNNNDEEIKRNYYTKNDNVSSIKIILDYNFTSLHKLFERCICIEKIAFIKCRKNITDMSYMFFQCTSLKEIKFINFNTENVTDMSFFFFFFLLLKKLDLSCFNT